VQPLAIHSYWGMRGWWRRAGKKKGEKGKRKTISDHSISLSCDPKRRTVLGKKREEKRGKGKECVRYFIKKAGEKRMPPIRANLEGVGFPSSQTGGKNKRVWALAYTLLLPLFSRKTEKKKG